MNGDGTGTRDHNPLPGAWRGDETLLPRKAKRRWLNSSDTSNPGAGDHSKLLELLGLINFKILSGNTLYIEVNGRAYKVLYGAYWRSVFSGVEHYNLKCEEIPRGMWIDGRHSTNEVNLAIKYADGGWLVKGHSLNFMLYGDKEIV